MRLRVWLRFAFARAWVRFTCVTSHPTAGMRRPRTTRDPFPPRLQPAELDASVLMRLPCRTSTDDRYFGDAWQALPVRGYTRIFENMLLRDPKITIKI